MWNWKNEHTLYQFKHTWESQTADNLFWELWFPVNHPVGPQACVKQLRKMPGGQYNFLLNFIVVLQIPSYRTCQGCCHRVRRKSRKHIHTECGRRAEIALCVSFVKRALLRVKRFTVFVGLFIEGRSKLVERKNLLHAECCISFCHWKDGLSLFLTCVFRPFVMQERNLSVHKAEHLSICLFAAPAERRVIFHWIISP